jgi:hypothetical protein
VLTRYEPTHLGIKDKYIKIIRVREMNSFNISHDENTWLNMYGRYNPYEDTLSIECEIDREEGSSYFDYIPTNAESQLMKDLITAKIHEVYRRSPKEFCEDAFDNGIGIGEMQQ